jgi:NAD(P)H-hydrate epimerase
VVTAAEMRAAEEAAFARGITAEALMEEAGAGIARAVGRFFAQPGACIVFAGKGHNAGDVFVAARHLREFGWQIETRLAFAPDECAQLTQKKLAELDNPSGAHRARPLILLDGLLGIGGRPPLREPLLSAAREINQLRHEQNAFVFSADLPSGLDADTGAADHDSVFADCTVTIGCAKAGLLADSAIDHVGRIELIALADLRIQAARGHPTLACPESLRSLLPRRPFSAYKNQFGRVGVVAGSLGLTGAAILCASGALRGGAGLVNLFVTPDIYPIIAGCAPPEVMVRPVDSYRDLAQQPVHVWAIGPGLGTQRAGEVRHALRTIEQPIVLDADGLNIVAETPELLRSPPGPRLLTPHPGEMKRLAPDATGDRATQARHFVEQQSVTLLLKGSRTIITERERPLSYNTTGTPAMATGGMGDVLTGLCAALIAQHLQPFDAARLGAWLAGRAAELALRERCQTEQSLVAGDIVKHLGRAFADLHS